MALYRKSSQIVMEKGIRVLSEQRLKARLKKRAINLFHRAVRQLNRWGLRVLGKLPKWQKTIMFESFSGKAYNDSPRAIYDYMREQYPDYHLYWSAHRKYLSLFERDGAPYVRRFSFRWIWLMARSPYWVINSRMPVWLPKPAGVKIVQTWHGTPLKKLAADMEEVHMPGTQTETYKAHFIEEARNWDMLVSPNAYSSQIFRRAFRFEGKMLETGYPRNDVLYQQNDPATIQSLKERCQLPEDKKVILYAPTWRDDEYYKKGVYKFSIQLDLDKMQERLGDEYIVLLRMHYLIAEQFDLSAYGDFVRDFSDYEDIRDLYLLADILLTDYSSVFFDYANLRRPILFYTYDLEKYQDTLRGFYIDMETELPGPLLKTSDEVIAAIEDITAVNEAYQERYDAFYERFCAWEDGSASARVAEQAFF